MFDADPYLLGLPGGIVGDMRAGATRTMERGDLITRRLHHKAKDEPTEVYDYLMRSVTVLITNDVNRLVSTAPKFEFAASLDSGRVNSYAS
jgi:hypothetical protein